MTFDELIAAMEKATGPDVALDCDIYSMLNPTLLPVKERAGLFVNDKKFLGSAGKYHIVGVTSMAPDYTASIDAALTLVPEEWAVNIGEAGPGIGLHGPFWAILHRRDGTLSEHIAPRSNSAATLALALCIAALKARQVAP